MAVFETWLKSDLKKPVVVQKLSGNLFSADNGGNLIGVEVMDNGSPATLTGGVTGYMIREDGATVTTTGTLSGNKASIVLPSSAYVVVGHISIVIKVGTTTVGACVGYVYRTTTDTLVDPGHVIPSIEELLAKIAACEQATTNANAATTSANNAATNANTKASLADEKATLANTAATSANNAATSATTAAGNANTAAGSANTAASAANTAATKIDDMTVSASGLPAGSTPTATISEVSGHKHIAFGLVKGDKGDKGNPGKDFHIAKTFSSVSAMMAYTGTDIEAYDFAMIDTGSVQDADTGKLYCYEPDKTPKWQYIGDLSGSQGIKGETGTGIDHIVLNQNYTLTIYLDDGTDYTTASIRGATGITPAISVGTVSTLLPTQNAFVQLDQSSSPEAPVFNFGIPKGETGSLANAYGTLIHMSESESTTVYEAINSKAAKVANATPGNFAGMDSQGNLTDSGVSEADFVAASDFNAAKMPMSGTDETDIASVINWNPEIMIAALRAIENVTHVAVHWNRAAAAAGGVGAGKLAVLVDGGNGQSIADTIHATNTTGLETEGSISQTVGTDTVYFSRPTVNAVSISIVLKAIQAPDLTTIGPAIQSAVMAYVNGLAIGDDLDCQKLHNVIRQAAGASAANLTIADVICSGTHGSSRGIVAAGWDGRIKIAAASNVTVTSAANAEGTSLCSVQDSMAILANGDTHAAISSGQFVYVKNHSSLAEGLYKATAAIATNAALSTSNLTADSSGGLNDLQSQFSALNNSKLDKPTSVAAGKFLQTDSNGNAVWGNAASPTDVANAVTDWLDDNIPTGQTVAVDQSLTVSGAAADAKVVGKEVSDLKSALSENTRNISTQKVGRYSANSSGVISKNDSNGNIFGMSDKVPCEANTQYIVSYYTASNQNGTIYAAYYDSNGDFLSADSLGSNVKAVFTTPATATFVYTWQYRSGGLSINDSSRIQLEKGYTSTEYIPPIVAYDAVARQGETLNIPYTEHPGYFSATGSISNPSASNEFYTDKIELSLFRTIGVGLSYGESRALWLVCCTYTADKSFIERITIQSATTKAYGQMLTFNANVKYVAFSYRKFTDGVMTIFGSVSETGMLESVRNLSEGFRDQTYLGDFPFRFMACYDHLFVNNSMPSITIPHESLYHVRFSRLFGFNAIEANVKKTATDGVYIVNHLESDKFGKYFHHVDGATDISDIKPSEKTWDWIVENVRYNSSIAKYQTRPCRLEEFLSECRQQNIIPFIYTLDDNVISIANEYMGDSNYIAYGASREKCPNAIIYHWVSRPTKAEILAYCKSVGRPFIYGMSNPTSFTDSELKDIVDTLHENGYWIGVSYSDQLWYKYSYLGFDVNGTQKYVNRLRNGNICNLNTMYGFGEFSATNATEANGVLTFSADGYIEPNIPDTAVNVGVIDLQVDFVGTITVYGIGEQRLDLTYTSDGAYPFFEATPIFNESPKFSIKATSGTVIKDISFIASKL